MIIFIIEQRDLFSSFGLKVSENGIEPQMTCSNVSFV